MLKRDLRRWKWFNSFHNPICQFCVISRF